MTDLRHTLSWKMGLISEMEIRRLQQVQPNPYAEFHIYKRLSGDSGLHLENLRPHWSVLPNGSAFEAPIIGIAGLVCLRVPLTSQTVEYDLAFRTRDFVDGKAKVQISYRVGNGSQVIQQGDVLQRMLLDCQTTAQNLATRMDYSFLTSQMLEQDISRINVNYLGIYIERVWLSGGIQWPTSVSKPKSDIPVARAQDDYQRELARIKDQQEREAREYLKLKFAELGVDHPGALIQALATQGDMDFKAIVDSVNQYQAQQDNQRGTQLQILQWLVEKDFVKRDQLAGLIDRVTGLDVSPRSPWDSLSFPSRPALQANRGAELSSGEQQTMMVPHALSAGARVMRGDLSGTPANAWLVADNDQEFAIYQVETRIGRKRDNHIVITGDDSVSREHVLISQHGDQFTVEDLGSKIGTFLNQTRLSGMEILRSGDVITIGTVKLQFFSSDSDQETRIR